MIYRSGSEQNKRYFRKMYQMNISFCATSTTAT